MEKLRNLRSYCWHYESPTGEGDMHFKNKVSESEARSYFKEKMGIKKLDGFRFNVQ